MIWWIQTNSPSRYASTRLCWEPEKPHPIITLSFCYGVKGHANFIAWSKFCQIIRNFISDIEIWLCSSYIFERHSNHIVIMKEKDMIRIIKFKARSIENCILDCIRLWFLSQNLLLFCKMPRSSLNEEIKQ